MCKREEYALAASDSVLLYETSNEQAYCFTPPLLKDFNISYKTEYVYKLWIFVHTTDLHTCKYL